MLDPTGTLPSSLLAVATTVHVALLVLRKYRLTAVRQGLWALVPSATMCASPWIFPTLEGLAAGLAAHAAWFAACEWLIPPAAERPVSRRAAEPPAVSAPVGAATRPPASATGAFNPLTVLAVLEETPTIRTFRFERPPSYVFEAGQFLTIRVPVDGVPHVRCYSISSAPESSGYLEISVKRQGVVSRELHTTMRVGARIWAKVPAGRFVYPAADGRPLLLIAGGVGITPLISMLRHAVATDPRRRVTLIYSTREPEELAFGTELASIAMRHAQFTYVPTMTGAAPGWGGARGRITTPVIDACMPDRPDAIVMMCGPAEMIDQVGALLRDAGLPPERIRSETFRPPSQRLAAGIAPASGTDAAGSTLELTRSRRSVRVSAGQSLLDAAEGAGAVIPSMCRAGVCGTCRTRLVSGDADCLSDALDARDREAGFVLPCVTRARGDCALEA